MSRATKLASAERRRATRRAGGRTGGIKNCQRGDKNSLRRRHEGEERRMDEAIEKLLLELAYHAFSMLRMVRVRW